MPWWGYAAGAAAVWALVNLLDTVIIQRHLRNPRAYAAVTGTFSIFPVVAVALSGQNFQLEWPVAVLCIAVGVATVVANWILFSALKSGDAAAVIGLLQVVPVFAAVWDVIFFGRIFSASTYYGVALVTLGGICVATQIQVAQTGVLRRKRGMTAGLVVSAAFTLSAGYAGQKLALERADILAVFTWGRIGACIGAAVLCLSAQTRRSIVQVRRAAASIAIGAECLNLTALLLLLMAYARGPLTLVTTVAATQPLFLVILLQCLFAAHPGFLPDSHPRNITSTRLLAITAMIIGIYLVAH